MPDTHKNILRESFDISPQSSDKWEPYFDIYYRHLKEKLGETDPKVLVEVGVQRGGSLYMWSRALSNDCRVIGIDVDEACATQKQHIENAPVEVVIGDQGDPAFWDNFLNKNPKIDIFIDDGGHYMDQQIITFEKVFPRLSVGGIYICEDTHTSYMSHNGGGLKTRSSFIEYAKSYVDILHNAWWEELDSELERRRKIGEHLTSVHFYNSVVVFEKFGQQEMKRVFPLTKFDTN